MKLTVDVTGKDVVYTYELQSVSAIRAVEEIQEAITVYQNLGVEKDGISITSYNNTTILIGYRNL